MGRRVRIGSALAAAMLAFVVVGTSTAHAQATLSKDGYKCQTTIAKSGAAYFNGKLKLIQKCKNANLKNPGSCTAPDAGDLQKLAQKLASGLAKACSFNGADAANLARLGFPGPCPDLNPGNGFTLLDLTACIQASDDKALDGQCGGGANVGEVCTMLSDCPDTGPGTYCRGLTGVEYDSTVAGPLTGTTLKCQEEVAKDTAKFSATLLKSIQKCRNALLNCKTTSVGGNDVTTCKLSGLAPAACATNDEKTKAAVDKAKQKALDGIAAQCSDPDTTALKICEPDQTSEPAGATCEVQTHQDIIDNPNPAALTDLIDYEYAQRGVCGDNRKNQPTEECDGNDATACPGQCGASDSFFPCMCENIPRTRIIEHATADLDNGWTGTSHDSGVVEGGGYVADLFDCDGPGGPDTLCTVGPSCALAPHQACNPAKSAGGTNADSICTGVGNFCRKTIGGSTGPHCEIEFKRRCRPGHDATDCPAAGDHCDSVFHGAPLPLSSGGVSVCVINTFTEDVVGTTDLATGASSVRLRQDSATYQGGDLRQPCPVCGGFCSGNAAPAGPNNRTLCSSNADCGAGSHCVTDSICSWGANIDQPCRPNPPFGGATEFFGNPSVDCQITSPPVALFGTPDILFNPATTGSTSLTANTLCNTTGFNEKRCAGGANNHAVCTTASECPGGTCNNQCFCPNTGGGNQKPTGCQPACFGGPDDASPCTSDSDCTAPGFCYPADCRVNPSDTDSAQEGLCTNSPISKFCSSHSFRPCTADVDCQAPSCPYCTLGETCALKPRECFVAPTIVRAGDTSAYVPITNQERTTAAIFCIAATGSSAVDTVAGLPGPGAITQPTNSIEVGF